MTKILMGCQTSERLRALVDGALSENAQAEIQKHVDGCASCQNALESLVAGSQSWDAAMGRLRRQSPSPEETVLADAMRRMKADEFVDAPVPKSIAFNPADYLEPSDHPGSLGRLGVYEVNEVIGQGGMGVVLKAFDPSLHRVVAVKVLAPYLAHNPQARKRFVREAQAIAAVSHDHVITIHAIDESAEQPKIVMQFVAGRSLQQKIDAEGSLELKEILRIGMQTASGLAAAHAQGLVHRDVKPSNILLENGVQRVRLTDFGLARAVDDASLTQSGVIAGTPQYMAPEQANGDAVDYRADLFSLGSVLYAMCVGHSPFRASTTMGVLKRVCNDPPRPIQEINPDIPDWLCAIVMKLLQKRAEDRYPTAKLVAELLEKWLAHVQQPMAVPKPAPIVETTNSSARNTTSGSSNFDHKHASVDPQVASRAIDRRTIFFQSVSWRWFSLFMLLGMALTVAMNSRGDFNVGALVFVGLLMGLVTSFFGLLLVGLGRFVWANIYGKTREVTDDRDSHAKAPVLAPESWAVLAAIVVMLFSGHPLLAAIVAIIVWRVANARAARTTVETSSSHPITAEPANTTTRAAGLRWLQSFDGWLLNVWQSLRGFGDSLFESSSFERNRLLISSGWFIAGGIDLWVMFNFSHRFSFAAISLLMSLLSFAVSLNVYNRQNFGFVRIASFIGLLPLAAGLVIRIPLSVVTLLWQGAPSTTDLFEPAPWYETKLGRWVWIPLRLLATFGWISVWTLGWLMTLGAIVALYVIPSGPSVYTVRDEAKVTLKGDPDAQFRLAAFGSGTAEGLNPPTQTYRRQDVLLEGFRNHGNRSLKLRLGAIVRNERTQRELSEADIEEFFFALFDREIYHEQAQNLFDAIQRLNDSGGFAPKVPRAPEPGWMSISERFWMTGEVLQRSGIDTENPPPGLIPLRSMLDPNLFLVDQGAFPSMYDCKVPTRFVEFGLSLWGIVWLLGIARIVRRRHFQRILSKPLVAAIAL